MREKEKEKEKKEDLRVLLSDCLYDLCQLCIRLNPQHKDCKQCNDTDDYRDAIND